MPKSQAQSTPKSKSVLTAAGTCAAAGLVAEGLVCTIDGLVGDAASGEAHAALLTGTVNQTVTTGPFVTVNFGGNPNAGTYVEVKWKAAQTAFVFSWSIGSALGRATASATYANLVGVTTGSINGAGTYWDVGRVHAGVANKYVGISFPNGGGAGQQRYGWIELGNYVPNTSIQVLNWGFEDAGNAAPLEKPVPEPGTLGLGLLALGAAGVSAYKRRRAKRAGGASDADSA